MKVPATWIAVAVGSVTGLATGVLLGVYVFDDDPPRTNLITVTTPAPTVATTVSPTTTTSDAPVGPESVSTPPSTFAPCDTFTGAGSDLPVGLCEGGDIVRLVQDLLRANGYDVTSDGRYGPQTAEAVVAFQQSVDLPSDGTVDAFTFRALCDESPVDICATN
ncbi:MAG: peptidoglycan-binding domain-containing protein [Actinobacteria bacterium]|nr:peptidoglycan-binding domain-containing protein [Actinomycetota bacterium]